MIRLQKPLAAVLPALALLAACGGGGGSGTSSTSSGSTSSSGTVNMTMTDAPACGFDHVYVTVDAVRINASAQAADSDAGWSTITLASPQKIDLLSLTNGALQQLGQTTLAAGSYQQIRLMLAANSGTQLANSVVPTGGVETALSTPSATQSGYKVVGQFAIQPSTLADVVLDFNACRSIVQRGNGTYSLKPVVTATPTVTSGSISGVVAPTEAGATVLAEQNGVVVRGTVADSKGNFTLTPLPQSSAGSNYDIVIAQNGFATGVIQSVPVSANAVTAISNSSAPISLPASADQTVSGTVTPATANATIRALQTLGGGTFEVTSVNANGDSGAYSTTLASSPAYDGVYSSTLPIVLAAVNSSAGKYAIEADPEPGSPKSSQVDVSVSSAVNVNFSF